ncbi:MAG: hypothetical protein ACPG47_00715 [Leucothrix sp.]
MSEFDVELEVKKLKKQTSTIRKKQFYKSRLDRYQGELLTLHKAGATCAELQRFLRTKRIKVVHSTVWRWLDKHG